MKSTVRNFPSNEGTVFATTIPANLSRLPQPAHCPSISAHLHLYRPYILAVVGSLTVSLTALQANAGIGDLSAVRDRSFSVCSLARPIPTCMSYTLADIRASTPALTPYQRGLRLEYGLDASGRIRKCDTAAQPNCVSSALSVSGIYSPPWEVTAGSTDAAMKELDIVLHEVEPETVMIDEARLPSGSLYRRYRFPNPIFTCDVFEVLVSQASEGSSDTHMVSYRYQAGTVKYIWPITQPVGDLGAHKQWLMALRDRLGWRVAGGGCDVLECFQENE